MTNTKSTRLDLSTEDRKLDALLRHAKPVPDGAAEAALLERILAAAERTPRLIAVSSQPRIEGATPAASKTALAPVALAKTARAHRSGRDLWGAAGLLAASLVVGVFLGQSRWSEQAVSRLEHATGISIASASQDAAFLLATADADEEDI